MKTRNDLLIEACVIHIDAMATGIRESLAQLEQSLSDQIVELYCKLNDIDDEIAELQGLLADEPKDSDDKLAAPNWICLNCAAEYGGVWPKGHMATWNSMRCDWCQEKGSVCPPGDWNWPNGHPWAGIGGRD